MALRRVEERKNRERPGKKPELTSVRCGRQDKLGEGRRGGRSLKYLTRSL